MPTQDIIELDNLKAIKLTFEYGISVTVAADDIEHISIDVGDQPFWVDDSNQNDDVTTPVYSAHTIDIRFKPTANTNVPAVNHGETLFSRLSDSDGYTDLKHIELSFDDQKPNVLVFAPFIAGDDTFIVNLCQIQEPSDDGSFALSISENNVYKHRRVNSTPHTDDFADGVMFDELLNTLYDFETRCQTVHNSMENKDPQARRQALALKRDIHLLRKTVEKQGIA